MNMITNTSLRFYAPVLTLAALSGCPTQGTPPPVISLDEPVQTQLLPEPPAPVEVVAIPEILPITAQLKPLPEAEESKSASEPIDEKLRVSRAGADKRFCWIADLRLNLLFSPQFLVSKTVFRTFWQLL